MLPSALDLPHKTPRAGWLAKLTHQTLAITSDIPHRPATDNAFNRPQLMGVLGAETSAAGSPGQSTPDGHLPPER